MRDTAGEVLGVLASNWTKRHKATIPGELTNIFMKSILEPLSDPKKEVQAAAGAALGQVGILGVIRFSEGANHLHLKLLLVVAYRLQIMSHL